MNPANHRLVLGHAIGCDHDPPLHGLAGDVELADMRFQQRRFTFDLVGWVLRGERVESARGGKEVHALDVARAVELLLGAEAERIAGQSFNGYDLYIAEEQVARIAKELTGSASIISDLNRGPKHQIDTAKIRALGLTFGGEALLRRTVQELIDAHPSLESH